MSSGRLCSGLVRHTIGRPMMVPRMVALISRPCLDSNGTHQFSSTALFLSSKKKDKGKDKPANSDKGKGKNGGSADGGAGGSGGEGLSAAEMMDFSVLESGLLKAIERLSHDLAQLRAGGQLSPDVVEGLPVLLDKNEKKKGRLSDVAQVVVRGRYFQVVVHDTANVKAVKAAIMASPHSLVPELHPTDGAGGDDKTIMVKLPPVSTESRQRVLAQATKAGETANNAIKEARLKHHKLIRSLTVSQKARSDHAHLASKKMEEIVKKATEEAKELVKTSMKVLQGTI